MTPAAASHLPGARRLLALVAAALVVGTAAAMLVVRTQPDALQPAPVIAEPAPPTVHRPTAAELHTGTVTVAVPASGAVDYLLRLAAGDAFAYSWTATVPVAFELHGHDLDAAGEPGRNQSTLEIGTSAAATGYVVAPIDGFFGWYFDGGPATVTLTLSGFHTAERAVPVP